MTYRPPILEQRPHDDKVCGIDPDTDCEVCRPITLRYIRMERVRARLEDEMRIYLGDLANLLWDRLEDIIRPEIERIALECLRRHLQCVKLVSIVDSYSAGWEPQYGRE